MRLIFENYTNTTHSNALSIFLWCVSVHAGFIKRGPKWMIGSINSVDGLFFTSIIAS
jgi:hypothetical protein